MSWLEIDIAATPESAERAGDLLEQMGAVAVAMRSGDDEDQVLEPLPGEQPLWGSISLTALYEPGAELDIGSLRSALATLGAQITDVNFLEEDDWQSRWQAHAVRACFGGRLWLLPRDAEPADLDVAGTARVLRLDPGLAFGSGSHPTTRLCLGWLAGAPLEGARVLDFGCGSGILALAACVLDAREVVAVDHDPQALVATRDNAAYNGVDEKQLRVVTPAALAEPPLRKQVFDVVIANILANPLVELAPQLTGCLAASGQLVLSGLLHHQEDMIRDAYPSVHFRNVAREGDWIRMDGVPRIADDRGSSLE